MTCGQAARLHPVDWRTRMAERLMAQCDGGFITRRQWWVHHAPSAAAPELQAQPQMWVDA